MGCATVRSRSLWPLASQGDHSSQSPKTQSMPDAGQPLAEPRQGDSSSRLPEHCLPPPCAWCSRARFRILVPLPQLELHSLQSPHLDSLQSSVALAPQPPVSSSAPTHGLPPFFGSCRICRLRYLW